MTRVGFIGTGRMGSALIKGFISKGLLKAAVDLACVKMSKIVSPSPPVLDSVLKNVHRRDFTAETPHIPQHVIDQLSFLGNAPAGAFVKRRTGRKSNKV